MSGLFTPEVPVALGNSASAGLATVLGSLFVMRMDKTNSHHLALAWAFAGGAMVYVSLVEIFPKSAASACWCFSIAWFPIPTRTWPRHHIGTKPPSPA